MGVQASKTDFSNSNTTARKDFCFSQTSALMSQFALNLHYMGTGLVACPENSHAGEIRNFYAVLKTGLLQTIGFPKLPAASCGILVPNFFYKNY